MAAWEMHVKCCTSALMDECMAEISQLFLTKESKEKGFNYQVEMHAAEPF